MSRIICGANELQDARWEGKTIEQVREELRCVMNIPDNAAMLLNGEEAPDPGHTLRSGDELEFVKPAGSKGKA
jgi:hypothetical protein